MEELKEGWGVAEGKEERLTVSFPFPILFPNQMAQFQWQLIKQSH